VVELLRCGAEKVDVALNMTLAVNIQVKESQIDGLKKMPFPNTSSALCRPIQDSLGGWSHRTADLRPFRLVRWRHLLLAFPGRWGVVGLARGWFHCSVGWLVQARLFKSTSFYVSFETYRRFAIFVPK